MWSNCFNLEKLILSEILYNEYKQTKLLGTKRKIIKHKNKFLLNINTPISKTSNFFVFKGFKLKYIKLFSYASLYFFRHFYSVKTPLSDIKLFKCYETQYKFDQYSTLLKKINESYLYHNFNTLIPLFLIPSLPMIKAVCLTKKHLKKKKALKAKLTKYTLQYMYVPHSQRALVVFRWFGLLVKMQNKSLVNSFIDVVLNISENNDNSFIIKIRNQVYNGLSLESDY